MRLHVLGQPCSVRCVSVLRGRGGHRGSPSCSWARSHSFQGSVFPSSEPTTCCLVLNPTLSCVSSVLMTLSW